MDEEVAALVLLMHVPASSPPTSLAPSELTDDTKHRLHCYHLGI